MANLWSLPADLHNIPQHFDALEVSRVKPPKERLSSFSDTAGHCQNPSGAVGSPSLKAPAESLADLRISLVISFESITTGAGRAGDLPEQRADRAFLGGDTPGMAGHFRGFRESAGGGI